jgi:hypothetical protein
MVILFRDCQMVLYVLFFLAVGSFHGHEEILFKNELQ